MCKICALLCYASGLSLPAPKFESHIYYDIVPLDALP